MATAKFPLGQLVATPGVMERVSPYEIALAVDRHCNGDWGEVDAHDREENELSLREGFRLLSAYTLIDLTDRTKWVRVWVITEADRSSTAVLLPEEY